MVGTDDSKPPKQAYGCGEFMGAFLCLFGHEGLAAQLLLSGGTRALPAALELLLCDSGLWDWKQVALCPPSHEWLGSETAVLARLPSLV